MNDDTRREEALGAWLAAHLDAGAGEAPDAELVAAYAEGRLSDEERDAVELMLAESDEGRTLLLAVSDDVGALEAVTPARTAAPRSRLRLITMAVAVAAILVLAFNLWGDDLLPKDKPEASDVLLARAFASVGEKTAAAIELTPLTASELAAEGPSAERGGIEVWEPAFAISGATTAFRWAPVAGAALYQIEVRDASGDVIYTAESAEPAHLPPPDAMRLTVDAAYRFEVRTRGSDGPLTGRRGFRTLPIERSREHHQLDKRIAQVAGPRLGVLARAHLAVRYGLWTEGRRLAQTYVRNHPRDPAGQALLARIHRQLGMPEPDSIR